MGKRGSDLGELANRVKKGRRLVGLAPFLVSCCSGLEPRTLAGANYDGKSRNCKGLAEPATGERRVDKFYLQ